ncbi:MAG: PKD domain-containing protein, partial [Lewinella sp.]|nr:PKD domain-containing protein [Lewinella sp.]
MRQPAFFGLLISLLFSIQLSAQEPMNIYGPEILCAGSCGSWEFEGSVQGTYEVLITLPGVSDVIFETTTNQPFVEWCPEIPGQYNLIVSQVDDNGTTIASGETFIFVTEGTYFGVVQGYQSTGCSPQDSFYLPLPFTNPGANCQEVCVGGSATISLQYLELSDPTGGTFIVDFDMPPGTGGNWTYSGPGVGTFSGGEITLQFQEPGTFVASYQYIHFSNANCDIVIDIPFCFEILPAPEASFTTDPPVSANGLLEICEGQTVYFTNNSQEAESFSWDFGDGTLSGEENPTHTFTQAGAYEVMLATMTACDCVDTTRLTVVV